MKRVYSLVIKKRLFSKKYDIMLINEGEAVYKTTVDWKEKDGEDDIETAGRILQLLKQIGVRKEKQNKTFEEIVSISMYVERDRKIRWEILHDLLDRWDNIGLESVEQALELSDKIYEWIKYKNDDTTRTYR